jgi:hypothetical protein
MEAKMNTTKMSQEIKTNEGGSDQPGTEASTMEKDFNTMKSALTVSQVAAICFPAGVLGAVAVVLFSHLLSQLGLVADGPIHFPVPLKSPGIYRPLFWGGLWGILFGLFVKITWRRLYLFGFLYFLAPMLATFLFFLPKGGAGYFGLQMAGPMFPLYVLLVNLPFGIVTAWAARAIINARGAEQQMRDASTVEKDLSGMKSALTVGQHAAIGFAAGVIGAAAVVACSYVLFWLGVSEALGVKAPIALKSPDIYKPLFWGGLWGVLFGLFIRTAWKRLYLIGFLYVVAPLAALFLFFLPMSGAGIFGLKMGPTFTLYLLLVNLPFGIIAALSARAIIGEKP